MSLKNIITLLLCAILACSCSKKNSSGYAIGIDPTWYSLQVPGQEKNILAFSVELLVEIAKKEHLQLAISRVNWNSLMQGLETKKYDAILGSLPLYNFNLKKYTFSDPYLMTGPILIVPHDSSISGTKQLAHKEVGVLRGSAASLILQSAPGVLIRNYDSIAAALVDLSDQQIEAVASDVLIAQDFLRNFYAGTLKIVGTTLNDEGLRLITMHGKDSSLQRRFNRGLAAFKKSGRYDQLIQKWGLSPDGKPVASLDEEIQAFLEKIL